MNSSIPAISEEPHKEPKRLEDLLIGEVLIEKGILNQKDFLKALQYKISERKNGRNISIGDAINITLGNLFQKISLQVGELLVANGLASVKNIDSARVLQQEYQKQGKTKLIGDICVEDLKIVTREALEKILNQQQQIASILPPITIKEEISPIKIIQESSQNNMLISSMKTDNIPPETFSSSNTPVNSLFVTNSTPPPNSADKEKAEWLSPSKLRLGEALVRGQYITNEDLEEALKYQKEQREQWKHLLVGEALMALELIDRRKFLRFTSDHGYAMQMGELLLAHWLISREDLEGAFVIQKDFRNRGIDRKIGDILVQDMQVVNKERLIQIVAKQKDMIRVVPNISETNTNLLFSFTKETLTELNFIPYQIYQKEDGIGCVVTVIYHENIGRWSDKVRGEILSKQTVLFKLYQDSLHSHSVKNLNKEKRTVDILFSYAEPEEISNFLEETFRNERVLRSAASRNLTVKKHSEIQKLDGKDALFVVGKNHFNPQNENLNIFADIIMRAIDAGSSDLHIEPLKNKMRIRIRVDGMLQTIAELPLWIKDYFIKGLKSTFHFKNSHGTNIIYDDRKRLHYIDKDLYADLRFSIVPTVHGEKLVTRILVQSEKIPTLEELGFQRNIARKYELICSMANGIVIVTGPTGSGKTTTLHATLSSLNDDTKNIITIENPPEYLLDGANQINAGGNFEIDFHEVLKGVLRQDPDILMFGEMRDYESAQSALTAGLTGRMLFTTLHTNDAVSAITRLIDMGIRPFLLGSTLVSILAQRLVRKICPKCKVPHKPEEKELRYFKRYITGIDEYMEKYESKFYKWKGCFDCRYTGFNGRLTIVELFCVNEALKIAVLEGKTASQLETMARKYGMTNMVEDGFYRALCGETTLSEVLRLVKTLTFPKVKRDIYEIEKLLAGSLTEDEMENAVYWGYDSLLEDEALEEKK